MTALRLLAAILAVSLTSSCALLGPLFGYDQPSTDAVSVYQSAMADFSLCETAPSPAERAAAAARLAQAASTMSATTQPTNLDHFYEMDRVTAAAERCQATLRVR